MLLARLLHSVQQLLLHVELNTSLSRWQLSEFVCCQGVQDVQPIWPQLPVRVWSQDLRLGFSTSLTSPSALPADRKEQTTPVGMPIITMLLGAGQLPGG